MWEINIFKKSLSDNCIPALKSLNPMLKDGSVKVEGVGTLEAVQALTTNVDRAVTLINQAGYETDEDE
jgi:hypothetical protein